MKEIYIILKNIEKLKYKNPCIQFYSNGSIVVVYFTKEYESLERRPFDSIEELTTEIKINGYAFLAANNQEQ